MLEAWLLALDGERGTEQRSKAAVQARFEHAHHFDKSTEQLVNYVERADLKLIPADALGLLGWLERAATILVDTGHAAP